MQKDCSQRATDQSKLITASTTSCYVEKNKKETTKHIIIEN